MMRALERLIYRIGLYFPGNEKRMLRHLKRVGIIVGDDVRLYGASSLVIDETRPWLLKIGNNVRITHGVQILTHDYSKSVLWTKYQENIGEGGETVIGNNVFVGMSSIILMGAHIGDNVIIGAGSVVHGNIPSNVVVAGNPARIICTLDEHLKKRRERTSDEAILVARSYITHYGRRPSEYEMRHFAELFHENTQSKAKWSNFEEFMNAVESDKRNGEDL